MSFRIYSHTLKGVLSTADDAALVKWQQIPQSYTLCPKKTSPTFLPIT